MPVFSEPFRAVIVAETEVSAEWMSAVSEWLVMSGCLYAMSQGPQASQWDTAIDLANLKAHDFGDIPEHKFVMTTWHDDDPLEEVFWFCKNNAFHSTVDLSRTLILHIAARPAGATLLQCYDEA